MNQQKNLWKTCFGDDDAFLDLYFRTRVTPEVCVTDEEAGTLRAMLHRLPYTLWVDGTPQKAEYISGACTHPDFRRQGRMERLLLKSFQSAEEENVAWSFLIPASEALFAYYAKFGYEPAFFVKEVMTEAPALSSACDFSACTHPDEEFITYINKVLGAKGNAVLHSLEDMQGVIGDILLAKGEVWKAYAEGQLVGVIFAVKNGEDVIDVKECLAASSDIRDALFAKVTQSMKGHTLRRLVKAEGPDASPLGMIRSIKGEPIPRNLYMSMMMN